jgi:feruloyl esterase
MRKWLFSASAIALCLISAGLEAQNCEGLAKLPTTGGATLQAKVVAAGGLNLSESARGFSDLPSFCRAVATLKPTADSEIGIEVWLPAEGWNGKYMAVGSGGWGGSIAYDALADALRRGYATSATDDGHRGEGGSFILGHPEKFVDFAYRAEHEMTVQAKLLIKAFYKSDPKYSYWNGCSGGGREGLLQAARYPEEFDGVIAGDPANMRRNAWALWIANRTFKDKESYIPQSKYSMIHRFVLDACDAKDGVKDGLIENPATCAVDFKKLACRGADAEDCLTARQVESAQTIISPATDAKGKVYFPRLEPGTEMRWARLAGGPDPADLFWDQFRYVVYQDATWDWRQFDLERDASKANAVNKGVAELDPQLASFAKRGGKLLMYQGWADQQVAPGSSVELYKTMLTQSGDGDWARLYMLPGMGHCSGGEGPDSFDKIGVLEQWVEKGKAPEEIVASHRTAGKVDRRRPLCPYPQVAKYKGSGSIDDAANFVCVISKTEPY